jgi:hypothetical protein
MAITHIKCRKDQWILEYQTATEHDELKTFALRLRDQFGAEFKEFSGLPVEWTSIAE